VILFLSLVDSGRQSPHLLCKRIPSRICCVTDNFNLKVFFPNHGYAAIMMNKNPFNLLDKASSRCSWLRFLYEAKSLQLLTWAHLSSVTYQSSYKVHTPTVNIINIALANIYRDHQMSASRNTRSIWTSADAHSPGIPLLQHRFPRTQLNDRVTPSLITVAAKCMALGNPGGEHVIYFIDVETAGNRFDLLHLVVLVHENILWSILVG
jgi:hypothetical protein